MKKIIVYLLIAGFIYGCAQSVAVVGTQETIHKQQLIAEPQMVATVGIDDIDIGSPDFAITKDIFDISTVDDLDDSLKEIFAEFDIPMTMTPRVQYYLKYFTGNGRATMQMWLDRSNKYMYLVRDTFRSVGIPQDLVVLGFTESGFNPQAYSHAGAAGMWQFMKSTGKIYDLQVNDWVDERRDFVKSTTAAAQHLKDLNYSFKDWYLALAAYNAGTGRISRATKAHNTKDFFQIATKRTLNIETRDYVPKYLAQLLIYKNMTEYGFTSPSEVPLLFNTIEVTSQVNLMVLAERLSVGYKDLKELNPELLTPMTPPVKLYTVRVPLGKIELATAFLSDETEDKSMYRVHNANAGDSLAKIAKIYGVNVNTVKVVNSFPYDIVYTKKVLFIPTSDRGVVDIDKQFAKEVATLAPKYYTVKKGDNFTSISKKYNMPLNTLVKLNPKVNPKLIHPGQVLVISQGGLAG